MRSNFWIIFVILLIAIPVSSGKCSGNNYYELSLTSYKQIQSQRFKITFSDSWFTKDKLNHLMVSAFLTAGSYYFLREEQQLKEQPSLYISTSFALSLGIAKEVYDGLQRKNAASIKDLVADIVGIGLGNILFNVK